MMERDSNSRTRRTKAALRASLAALIQEKGLADVTVASLLHAPASTARLFTFIITILQIC